MGVSLTEHAITPRYCVTADLMDVTGDSAESAAIVAASDEYLKHFAAPITDVDGKIVCFHCGKSMDAVMHAFGIGAAFVWGIRHGEAKCSSCGWPARGMHSPKDGNGEVIYRMSNFFLSYHPDVVGLND